MLLADHFDYVQTLVFSPTWIVLLPLYLSGYLDLVIEIFDLMVESQHGSRTESVSSGRQ